VIDLSWTKIVEIEKPNIKDVVLIQGLPGLGLVGKLTVDYIVTELKLKKFAELYSNNLMLPDGKAGVIINMYGVFELPRYEFFYHKTPNDDLVFLAGNTQAVSWAQYEVSEKVLKYLIENFGVKLVIAACGTVARGRDREVFIASNDEDLLKEWATKYGLRISSEGTITGAAGLLPGLAKLYGIKGVSLMGPVGQIYPDPIAAKLLLQLLDKMFNLNLDYTKIEVLIQDMRKRAEIIRGLVRHARAEVGRREEREEGREPWYYV